MKPDDGLPTALSAIALATAEALGRRRERRSAFAEAMADKA